MDENIPAAVWWRRKRWAGAAAAVISAYALSFVPACWLMLRTDPSGAPLAWAALRELHRPTAVLLTVSPRLVRDGVRRLVDMGAPNDTGIWIDRSGITFVVPFRDDYLNDDYVKHTRTGGRALAVW